MNKYTQFSKKGRAPEYKAWKSCGKKKMYTTEDEARQLNQMHYKCKRCGYWHRSGSLITSIRTNGK